MDDSGKTARPAPDPESTVIRGIRWNPADLERIERAAEVLSARERLSVSATDLIRRGALKEADEILAERAA